MKFDEQSLAEACQRADREGRKELYEQYAGRLLSVCLRYVSTRSEAEDLLHDSFLKIFGAIDRFTYRGKGSLRAWMERVTINLVLERLRAKSKFIEVDIDQDRTRYLVDEPQAEELDNIPTEILQRFIGELPVGYRTVFNLYYIEEYSHREIAQMLGIHEKSSSSQLFRARQLLARKIKDYLNDGKA